MKKWIGEEVYRRHLTDKGLPKLLEHCDLELAEECRSAGCRFCGAKLHSAHYKRKPRGMAESAEMLRYSFCCARDGCRKRNSPDSVRFLGRKVYLGMVVVLVSAMRHGLSPERMKSLRGGLSVNRRTLERWRAWWRENFTRSDFWKVARARFMPLLGESTLPLPLCETFEIDRRDRLLDLLRFIAPVATSRRFNGLI